MFLPIHTERLILREVTLDDTSALCSIWSDPEVTKYMNITPFSDKSQAEEMISLFNSLSEKKEAVRFAIIEKASGGLLGSCGYNLIDKVNAKTEIGYELSSRHWGKGYGSETVSGLVRYAFESMNMNRIEARVEAENHNSVKMLEKLSFQYEGTLREAELSKGRYVDLKMYSKLKGDQG
ncbi:GNAT family N-acetyltransferase [Salipaludibacillus aurantiacus]|uniref:Ribosomal-protein-alanine N-acetyltransferase n=1 Tax=Salipaludibacillus aurantiacus TaxID=1601833 RepID=A0A1H9UAG2_9BACI|nr:GNAT family protein [Salipaludibacillus aurantiacus]SES06083.1 ribosomal-protein-alanine N-acetyltransferase [Salipaludibacillus aurantiacus]